MLKHAVTKELEALKVKLKENGSLHIRDMDSLVLATGTTVCVNVLPIYVRGSLV